MMPLAPAALFGFVVGLRHATEADHVAAVSAIVARERSLRGAALVGAAWGLGHTVTLLLLGGAIVVFGLVVPRSIGIGLEVGVGAMLIVLGLLNLRGRVRRPHDHVARGEGGAAARELHGHAHDLAHEPPSSVRRALRPLAVGGVHGLAGSAAAALLVVATMRTPSWGVAYLLLFGFGAMLGMTALTTALALPLGRALRRFHAAEVWLRVGSGALSVAIGAFVIYENALRSGLLPR